MICGGVGQDLPANDEIKEICGKVRPQIQEKVESGRQFEVFEVVKYRSQVVAGMNFFVKIHIGEGKHLHVRIYRDLQQNVSVHGLQENKEESDELSYF